MRPTLRDRYSQGGLREAHPTMLAAERWGACGNPPYGCRSGISRRDQRRFITRLPTINPSAKHAYTLVMSGLASRCSNPGVSRFGVNW
jgi:hypothetical protein